VVMTMKALKTVTTMGFKQNIALFFNTTLYIAIVVGLLFLFAGIYAFAAILIIGAWCIDRLYFKRWCIGFHSELREDVSIQILPTQKGDVDDIIDVAWEELKEEE